MREGAYAEGVIGVLPTVTWPNHMTLITGVPPAVHGIYDNRVPDPEGRSVDGPFDAVSLTADTPTVLWTLRNRS